MTDKLTFDRNDLDNWGDEQTKLIPLFDEYRKSGKSFDIEYKYHDENKSPLQLRSYWRLVGLVLPHLKEIYKGEIDNKEDVSSFIKTHCKYCKTITAKNGPVLIEKSLKVASKKELITMIERLLFICEHLELEDYELTKQEKELLT